MTAAVADPAIVQLRAELKQWEKDFAQAHEGRKPGREDIKADISIAEKYSRFNKATRHVGTPQKTKPSRQPLQEHPMNIPVNFTPSTLRTTQVEIEPTPAHIRCGLGPTPQKDGQVLSIFDLFAGETPSKDAVAATPCKAHCDPGTTQHSRTPQSSSKRYYLDAFAGTPLKRKCDDAFETPASTKRQFATPAFLKREQSSTIYEEDEAVEFLTRKPRARQGMNRSFSAMVANLRKHENERMDEEWEILRELEAEEAGVPVVRDSQTVVKEGQIIDASQIAVNTSAVVNDIHLEEMPLGPDEAPMSDEDEGDPADLSRKVWKKKGLKRQTKKSNMKPVLHAPQKAVEAEVEGAPEPAQEGAVKKAVRKVNEAMHMNYRRLKIKNKNSKAKGRGRFGKR